MHTVQWPRLSDMAAMTEMKAMNTGAEGLVLVIAIVYGHIEDMVVDV